jgi:hypothetical protein
MLRTTLILGAGFSRVAGLPLTRSLFETNELPRHISTAAADRHKQVMHAWRIWISANPDGNAEEWLAQLYDPGLRGAEALVHRTSYQNAIDFALARLVQLPPGKNAHYYHGVTTSVECKVHRQFWGLLRRDFDLKAVVTMNYDILAEQGLHETYSSHRTKPLFHYGGFPYTQYIRQMTDVTTKNAKDIKLDGPIALFKMHGSLNWSYEWSPDRMKMHDDVRAVFRSKRAVGVPQVVPPVAEKDSPDWLRVIWNGASEALGASHVWFVCGYSLPEYDKALREFFKAAAAKAFGLRIFISDPHAAAVSKNWTEIAPKGTHVEALPGLPEVLESAFWPK